MNRDRGDDRRWRPDMMQDDDEGYRTIDRHGGGQSGYGSGRMGDDRSMGSGYRNQSTWNRNYDDRQGMHTDDRFTGRGGPSYWEDRRDRDYNPERHGAQGGYGGGHGFEDRHGSQEAMSYNSGYNRGNTGYGGYDQQGIQQNVGSHMQFRGGSAGAQYADDYNQGRYPDMYGPTEGNLGHPGEGEYGQRYPRSMRGGLQRAQPSGNYGQGMHRGKGPQGYTRSDDRIKETVCEALTDDDQIDASHIEVVVKNGEVMLTGTVEDRRTKRLVEDVIERLPGVKDIQNQLRVRGNQDRGSSVGRNETETSPQLGDRKHRA